jgi:hypothetical protein
MDMTDNASEDSSRKALEVSEFNHLSAEKLLQFERDNVDRIREAPPDIYDAIRIKHERLLGSGAAFVPEIDDTPEDERPQDDGPQRAPAFIRQQDDSEWSGRLPEAPDILYVKRGLIEPSIDYFMVEDPMGEETIEIALGLDPETRKQRVARVPARREKVLPEFVLQYLGSVVADAISKNTPAVHATSVMVGRRRYGYVFDRTFIHNGKRLDRCCFIIDRVHQAGLLFESFVHRQTHKTMSRIRRQPGTQEPMYRVVGLKNQEQSLRDLRRLYERHFMFRRQRYTEDDDPALAKLLNETFN